MLRDFVRETANNPGSSATINLIGPVTGRQGFVAAFGSGATVYYTLEDGTQWETGVGTVASGTPNTLTRTTVLRNSLGTTARLNFTGLTRVFNYLPADRVIAVGVEPPWVDVASAGTTDIGAAAGQAVRITGTTTITALGTAPSGVTRKLRFAASLTLTHNASSLILPGGASIVTAAGDTAEAVSLGGGNWIVTYFQPAGGYGWQLCEVPRVVTSVAQLDFALPTAFRAYRLQVLDAVPSVNAERLLLRFSSDGGATFLSSSNYRVFGNETYGGVNYPFDTGALSRISLGGGLHNNAANALQAEYIITPGSATIRARVRGLSTGATDTPVFVTGTYNGVWEGTNARMNAIRLFVGSGTLSATFVLEGLR
jgi:hypothetical protein